MLPPDEGPADRSHYQSYKLRRIFYRQRPPLPGSEANETQEYRYIVMEMPWERVKTISALKASEVVRYKDILKTVPYNPARDAETFALVFNTILMTSPDPYRPITKEEAKIFGDGTFLTYAYGQPAGFAVLTHEKDEGTQENIGVIAGIGIMPKFRGRRFAIAFALGLLDWFKARGVSRLQCEVYEHNDVSHRFITSLGFSEVGEMFLGRDQAEAKRIS
ncbi:MAG TPA: GNAT family N-acetyltransferase [Candidatus Hodarchaeales archaeon]|nr:GNAT family N-acetyltransferase [Candidatus Hodarchaeales archaeon]